MLVALLAFIALASGLALFGCTGVNLQDNNFTASEPALSDNFSRNAFIQVGCIGQDSGLNCSAIGLEQKYSCDYVYPLEDYLVQALGNKTALMMCWVVGEQENSGLPAGGCLRRLHATYLALQQDGQIIQINSSEQLSSVFGPVDSKGKALAFAVLLSNSQPKYSATTPKGFEWKTAFHPTKISANGTGFTVNLFYNQECGCGTHPYYEATYSVSRNGSIETLSEVAAYENPSQDICVD